MDEDKLVAQNQDGDDEQGEGGEKGNAKPPENIKGRTVAAAWVGLALSIADVPNAPPSPALLKVKKLLGPDRPKSE